MGPGWKASMDWAGCSLAGSFDYASRGGAASGFAQDDDS